MTWLKSSHDRVDVTGPRIFHFDLRHAVDARHALARAVGQDEDDQKVVLAHERAFEFGAVGERDLSEEETSTIALDLKELMDFANAQK